MRATAAAVIVAVVHDEGICSIGNVLAVLIKMIRGVGSFFISQAKQINKNYYLLLSLIKKNLKNHFYKNELNVP